MSHKNTPGLRHSAILATSILFQVVTNSETESTLQKFSKVWMEPPPGVSETLQRFCPYLETLNNIPFLFLVALLLLFLVSVSSTPWLLLGEFLHRSRTPKFFSSGSGSGKPVEDRSQRTHGRKLWDRTTLHVLHILSLKTCSRLWLWNCR